MTAPVLTFSKGYSLRQKEVAMSRYAAVIRLLLDNPHYTRQIHGALLAGMARHGLVSNHLAREVTAKGRAWYAAYDGLIADPSEVTMLTLPASRRGPAKAKPNTPTTILKTMTEHPDVWLFIHRPALDKLSPIPFYLLTWLGAHTTVRTIDAIAAGVGWSAEAVSIALRAIRDAGYTVDIVGESAAD